MPSGQDGVRRFDSYHLQHVALLNRCLARFTHLVDDLQSLSDTRNDYGWRPGGRCASLFGLRLNPAHHGLLDVRERLLTGTSQAKATRHGWNKYRDDGLTWNEDDRVPCQAATKLDFVRPR